MRGSASATFPVPASPQHRVGHGAGDVPRFGVPERPRPRRARQLTGRPGSTGLTLAVPSRKLLGDIAKRGLTELAHRLRRQPPLAVGAAVQEALVHQRAFQLGQRAGVDGGLVAELTGQHVQVDIVHRGAGVALRELLGKLFQLADIGTAPGRPPPCPADHRRRIAPSRSSLRQGGPTAGAQSSRFNAFSSDGDPNACCANASSSARWSADRLLRKRCAAAARFASESSNSSILFGFSGKILAVLGHEVIEILWRVLSLGVLVEEVVEIVEHRR